MPEKPPKPALEVPLFPYVIGWEEVGKSCETLEGISANAARYEARFEVMRALGAAHLVVDRSAVFALVSSLDLDDEATAILTNRAMLLAGWQLAPAHRRHLKVDIASTQRVLQKIAAAAHKLWSEVNGLGSEAGAIMSFLAPHIGDRLRPNELVDVHDLAARCFDLSLLAQTMRHQMTRKKAAPNKVILDTTVRRLIEAVEEATGRPVQYRRKKKTEADPHMVGREGAFVRDLIRLIDPAIGDRSIALSAFRTRQQEPRKSESAVPGAN